MPGMYSTQGVVTDAILAMIRALNTTQTLTSRVATPVPVFDGQPVLVEELEFHVQPRIVGFRCKWVAGTPEYQGVTPVFAPVITKEQSDEMMTLAARVCDAIGIRDYGRVDFRMDAHGRIYVLEANPNPDISAESGFRGALDAAHISYADFIARLLDNALRRGSLTASGNL